MNSMQTIDEEELNWFAEQIKSYDSFEDPGIVLESYKFSKLKHEGQFRKSGEPYFVHCKETAKILLSWHMDVNTVSAGLLHDVLEDTSTTSEELIKIFGPEVTRIVEGVTKINKMYFSKLENQAESLRKMILAVSKDIRVILIKLADRLHNMRTLEYLQKPSQIKIARETLEIYAQLAHRLGMEKASMELRDLALRYLDPDTYNEISNLIKKELKEQGRIVEQFSRMLRDLLLESGIQAEVEGRRKDIYSIYQKIKVKGVQFGDIYDLFAFRVLVNAVADCYASLGVIHSKWKPVPNRIKDYIAMAKSNGYQSLHTTIIGPFGKPIEIQIRTFEMHEVAENGIAAHWKYKDDGLTSVDDKRFTWLRQIVEDLQELRNPRHLLESVRFELFPEEVYVFTPKGEVKVLPQGATPIDFAYSVHTEVGNTCVGAKVNGVAVPFRYELNSGDIVEIITRSGAHPSKDWLKYAKSSKARSKIRHWIREQERAESIKLGQDLLQSEMQSRRLNAKALIKSEQMEKVIQELNLTSIEDLMAHIGYGKISAQHVANLLAPETMEKEEQKPLEKPRKVISSSGVKVGGIGQPFVRFAKCCNPIPGDDIVGFITRGRGVTIHVVDCREISGEYERILDAEWDIQGEKLYPVEISIDSDDKKGLLADVTAVIAKEGVNIESARVVTANEKAETNLKIQVANTEHLRRIMDDIRHIKGVNNVERRV
ncbi:MAG: RelA/SpoT family protein [bacterium]